MYPYNDEVGWDRLMDVQREMESNRVLAHQAARFLGWIARPILWMWEVVALALRPLPAAGSEHDAAADACPASGAQGAA